MIYLMMRLRRWSVYCVHIVELPERFSKRFFRLFVYTSSLFLFVSYSILNLFQFICEYGLRFLSEYRFYLLWWFLLTNCVMFLSKKSFRNSSFVKIRYCVIDIRSEFLTVGIFTREILKFIFVSDVLKAIVIIYYIIQKCVMCTRKRLGGVAILFYNEAKAIV